MSVATAVATKSGKKPQYKDYVSFLDNYKNGKKDDQNSIITNDSGVSFSLSSSSNNSSCSVYSDVMEPPKNSFKNYLEHYNNKKYSPVQPPVHVKKDGEAKTVKTEVFLEINSPPSTVTKVVDISNGHGVRNVSKVFKMFENNTTQNENHTKSIPPSGKVNTFNFNHKDAQRKTSVGGMAKKFEGSHHKIPLRKSNSISEKSKVFEDSNNSANDNKFQKDEPVKMNGCVSPKPLIHPTKPVFIAKVKTENISAPRTNGSLSPKPAASIKPVVVPKVICETLTFHQTEDHATVKTNSAPLIHSPKPVIAPKIVTETIHLEKTSPISTPPPPPSPPLFQQEQTTFSPPTCPPPPHPFQNGTNNAPPPPPPPPANFTVKKPQYSPPKATVPVPVNAVPKKNDMVDGTAPVIDKNDPRVKRLVYGALREMYGAYHDKANDYIATLPRNRVKKNNGLDSIINSIASQGGLEKLNGRVNPSVETD